MLNTVLTVRATIIRSNHWELFLEIGVNMNKGYIEIDLNILSLLEQVHFPAGKQSWKVILLSKKTGQLFHEVCTHFFLYVSKISQTVKKQRGSPVLDNLEEQLDFPGHVNIEE